MNKFVMVASLIVMFGILFLYLDNATSHFLQIRLATHLFLSPTPNQKLANPASVNCIKKGGTLTLKTRGDGGEYGLCNFADNMSCEEWALLRGDCPQGGVKTTGYDNIEQMYCAWMGGKTLAIPNAMCTLPNNIVCSVKALYNGTCPS